MFFYEILLTLNLLYFFGHFLHLDFILFFFISELGYFSFTFFMSFRWNSDLISDRIHIALVMELVNPFFIGEIWFHCWFLFSWFFWFRIFIFCVGYFLFGWDYISSFAFRKFILAVFRIGHWIFDSWFRFMLGWLFLTMHIFFLRFFSGNNLCFLLFFFWWIFITFVLVIGASKKVLNFVP